MKRKSIQITLISLVVLLSGSALVAQEKRVEKRIKIVTVDENGQRVETDTIITADGDKKTIYVGHGGEKMVWTVIKSDKDHPGEHRKGIYIIGKDGDKSFTITGSDSVVWTDDDMEIDEEMFISSHLEEPGEGESIITIRSSDGFETMKIKGDAIITIKDGSVKVENSSAKVNESNKGDVISESKEVKKIKKEK